MCGQQLRAGPWLEGGVRFRMHVAFLAFYCFK